jgi:hypothetical protein
MKIIWFLILWRFSNSCYTTTIEREYFKASDKVLGKIKHIGRIMKSANSSLVFHKEAKLHEISGQAFFNFTLEHYFAYQSQLKDLIQSKKLESEISYLKKRLLHYTSTTLQPELEKYYDNSKETTTTPYPPLQVNDSRFEYLLKKKHYYEEALRKEEIKYAKSKKAESYWSDENYFS